MYSVTLQLVEVRPEGALLSGGLFLGPLLGTFHCQALVTSTQFDARFQSRRDSGRFVLMRACR